MSLRRRHLAEQLTEAYATFGVHRGGCGRCSRWDGTTGQLGMVCWEGSRLFKARVRAELEVEAAGRVAGPGKVA